MEFLLLKIKQNDSIVTRGVRKKNNDNSNDICEHSNNCFLKYFLFKNTLK